VLRGVRLGGREARFRGGRHCLATLVTESGARRELGVTRGAFQTQPGAAPEAEVRPGGVLVLAADTLHARRLPC
jgi:hypothetical protein